jgi:hypothetical protein
METSRDWLYLKSDRDERSLGVRGDAMLIFRGASPVQGNLPAVASGRGGCREASLLFDKSTYLSLIIDYKENAAFPNVLDGFFDHIILFVN